MENASKALIIAGAILLSILIIGLGMFIYQQAAGAMSGANLDPQKVQAYNAQFEQYEGDRKSGSNVKALLTLIRNHNNTNIDDESLQIAVTYSNYATAAKDSKSITDAISKIQAGKAYKIEFNRDDYSGYINAVTITDATTRTNN